MTNTAVPWPEIAPHTTRTVEHWLTYLGDITPEKIAALLHLRGIRGDRESGWNCPIAKLLSNESGHEVLVDNVHLAELVGDDEVEYDVPRSVGEFILCFDGGDFDELVDTEDNATELVEQLISELRAGELSEG